MRESLKHKIIENAKKLDCIWKFESINQIVMKNFDGFGCSEVKTVSQCFSQPASLPSPMFITLYCGHRRRISVRRVVQGSRRHHYNKVQLTDHCGFIDGDCISEGTAQADIEEPVNLTSRWISTCNGRQYCVQNVGQPPSGTVPKVSDMEISCEQQTPVYIMVSRAVPVD